MGNLQSNDPKSGKPGKAAKVKTLMKIRGKRNKQDDINNQFTGVVPKQEEHASASEDELTVKETRHPPKADLLVTDSWCKVNKTSAGAVEGASVTPSADSSSDSVFAEALTPVGFSTEINLCYRSEDSFPSELEIPDNFLHDLTLNSFKLNEYRARKEDVGQKLSKLGVSRTSQISLETDPNECFVSDNVVEVVRKDEYSEADGEESGFEGSGMEATASPGKVSCLAKRLSETNLYNGKWGIFVQIKLQLCYESRVP